MKKLQLNFLQRVRLVDVLGMAHGPIKDVAPIWEFIKGIRLTEAEQAAVNFTVDGQLRRWDPFPTADFGAISYAFEASADAAAVLRFLEHFPHFEPVDMVWLEGVLEQL
jgi:hypothetical protein